MTEQTTINIGQDPTMPVGRCLVVNEDLDILYSGRLADYPDSLADMPGLTVILHPIDFAVWKAFYAQLRRPN